jgi:hypothetical protein
MHSVSRLRESHIMTVGWIFEDAWERYLAAQPDANLPPPGPLRVRCPFCATDFAAVQEMLDHLQNRHRGERPVLLLGGREPSGGGSAQIRTSIRLSEVVVQNCSEARLGLDGAAPAIVSAEQLQELLTHQRDAVVDIELINQYDQVAQPIRSSYRLIARIPDKRALDAVDRAFKRHLASDALDFRAVDDFLSDRSCAGVARDYAARLAAYVRGRLVKDRPLNASPTLPYARYRELYGEALDGLDPYRRPLSDLVCSVIRFALNIFSVPSSTGYAPLDGAFSTLERLAGYGLARPVSALEVQTAAKTVEVCPLDDGVSRVLALWQRLRDRPQWTPSIEEECRQAAGARALDAPDKQKVLALWAGSALRVSADASEPLSLLSATHPFGAWASGERNKAAQ